MRGGPAIPKRRQGARGEACGHPLPGVAVLELLSLALSELLQTATSELGRCSHPDSTRLGAARPRGALSWTQPSCGQACCLGDGPGLQRRKAFLCWPRHLPETGSSLLCWGTDEKGVGRQPDEEAAAGEGKHCPRAGRGGLEGLGMLRARSWGINRPSRCAPLLVYTLSLCVNAHTFRKRCQPRHRLPEQDRTPHPHAGIRVSARTAPPSTHTLESTLTHSHSLLVITKTHSCPFSRICDYEGCGHTHTHAAWLGPSHSTLPQGTQPLSLPLTHTGTPHMCPPTGTPAPPCSYSGPQPINPGHPGTRAKELPSKSCS